MKRFIYIFFYFIFAISLIACGGALPPTADELSSEDSRIADQPLAVWLPPYLPDEYSKSIHFPEGIICAQVRDEADGVLDVGSSNTVTSWVYVLAAPFSTITEEISLSELRNIWEGKQPHEMERRLLVSGDTKALFEKLWGLPSNHSVRVTASTMMIDQAWNQEKTWAILPFEKLEPEWKVISIDGQSPISPSFIEGEYPLVIPFSFIGPDSAAKNFQEILKSDVENNPLPHSNRYSDRLTTVMLTGVTALTRGTAYLMEKNGMTYPAIDIGERLRAADILHISNEVPFTDSCPNPFTNPANDAALIFCSKSEYIQLLEAIGTDVVELTGDHFRDWGADAMLNTIAMFEERGWQYYGGGRNYDDGVSPALFEHNGNKIAFLGCNAKPRGYATAREDSPGAVHCDMDRMAEEVKVVRQAGYLPIFTFQHIEYYEYKASEKVALEFHQAADAGAVIVSGSQAHIPQAIEFYKNTFIHYGLGNLFFDQFKESFAQRQAFIDEHIIYDGRYINTRLIPIQFIDLARPREMEEAEREELLEIIFDASGWRINY
jgi:poly-gamma-glutamate synthesis protein (capsule biosynthesis protein)